MGQNREKHRIKKRENNIGLKEETNVQLDEGSSIEELVVYGKKGFIGIEKGGTVR